MAIKVKAEEPFKILYDYPKDTNIIICVGGRGGMKTYEVSKFVAYSSAIKKKRCVILRDEHARIKETILNEILTRYDTANVSGKLDVECIRLETGIKDRETGKELVYTKGFRASSTAKSANMKGMSDIDIAIIEEAEDLRDPEKFDTFVDGLRKEGCLVIIMMNTADIGHFLMKRYFNFISIEHDGYYKLEPKQIDGFIAIQTDYTMNKYLPKHIINNYEGYGQPEHHLYNIHHYLTAILGYASTGRKGQILKKVKTISLKEYMALPFPEVYGQDFGTASPAALIGVKFDGNKCYARQINYLPKNVIDLGILYCELGFTPQDKIVADHADKEACTKLKNGFTIKDASIEVLNKYPQLKKGFFIRECQKPKSTTGQSNLEFRISLMDSLELYGVEESTDLWNEIMSYCYAQDKYGNYTGEPIDDFNHLIDGWAYVIIDRLRPFNFGFG